MSNKNYAAVAVLALAGAFASQAQAGNLSSCAAVKTDASAETFTSKTKPTAVYKVAGTNVCEFKKVGDTTLVALKALDLNNSKDAETFATLSDDFVATAATTTAAAAEKPKDPCDNVVEKNRTASTVIGGVLGGVIGKKVFKNDAGTVGGAVVGGVAGNQIAKCDHK